MSETLRPISERGNTGEILQQFSALWDAEESSDSDSFPDIVHFIERCVMDDTFADVVLRLVQIDIERRWKFPRQIPHLTTAQYEQLLPVAISRTACIELVSHEYKVRNRWGDCVLLHDLLKEYQHLGNRLAKSLQQRAAAIFWPVVSLVDGQDIKLEIAFDRRITAGRQRPKDPAPWHSSTSAQAHHLVLCDRNDNSLSRDQLRLTLASPHDVMIQNTSSNRSIAVRNSDVLPPREKRSVSLPAYIHLGKKRYLQIRRPDKTARDARSSRSSLPFE